MAAELYTIGHSVHTLPEFFALLRAHAIEVLVDVRSKPYSRYVPHFNHESIRAATIGAGLRYVYLGQELGGYPPNPNLFPSGLRRLLSGMNSFRVAVMCAEEDPANCHRHHLIGSAIRKLELPVHHVRGTGVLETWEETEARRQPQPSLF